MLLIEKCRRDDDDFISKKYIVTEENCVLENAFYFMKVRVN